MNKLIALSVLFATASAHAQPTPGLPPVPNTEPPGMSAPSPSEQAATMSHEEDKRNIGIGLTIIGAVGVGVGLVYLIPNWNGKLGDPGTEKFFDGALVEMVSVPIATTGAFLWGSGYRGMRAAERAGFKPVAATPYVAPIQGGAVAGIQCATW